MITMLDFSNPPSSADDTDKMDFSDSLLHSSYTKNHLAFLDPSPNESMTRNQTSTEENRNVIDEILFGIVAQAYPSTFLKRKKLYLESTVWGSEIVTP